MLIFIVDAVLNFSRTCKDSSTLKLLQYIYITAALFTVFIPHVYGSLWR